MISKNFLVKQTFSDPFIKPVFACDDGAKYYASGCGGGGCGSGEKLECTYSCWSCEGPACNCGDKYCQGHDCKCVSVSSCQKNCDENKWGSWSKCSKSCGGGTETRKNDCGTKQTKKCNTQSCVPKTPTPPKTTATPIPTATPVPLTVTPIPPTATPIPPTATPVPGCLCNTNGVCATVCAFDKFDPPVTYTDPIKCNLSTSLFATAPSEDNKTSWCQATKRTKGDADGNGVINNADYFYYVAAVNGGKIPVTVNPDFNGDDEVGAADRTIIIKSLNP